MTQLAFSSLKLDADLLTNIDSLGYQTMTPIQSLCLPHILAGKDVMAQGKTGSGKTAAFSLGLLQKLDVKRFTLQSLVLCPTRELAEQVAQEIRKLGRTIHNIKVLTLCGGTPFGPQKLSLEHGCHIIVGTPGRIEDHLSRGTLRLDNVNLLILDEADRMLDMGFEPAIDTIMAALPSKRQTLLFSATFPATIQAIAQRQMRELVRVEAKEVHDDSTIEQHLFEVADEHQRIEALRLLLLKYTPKSTVVFCNTKVETQAVADELNAHGFKAIAIHGDLEQRDRELALVLFANESASVLVATDVAARGLDIDSVEAVINYHIAHELEVHTHRIGRTGRGGSKGIACTLYSVKEASRVVRLEEYLGRSINVEPLPSQDLLQKTAPAPAMMTLQIAAGKKQKLRPGDILGALTAGQQLSAQQVGKIQIGNTVSYVAVCAKMAKVALEKLSNDKLKGRHFKVRLIKRLK